jgi:uncharacterized membrane protein
VKTLRQLIQSRPRLLAATCAGLLLSFALPADWNWLTRALIGWNAAVWSYLVLVGWLMVHANHVRVCQIAVQEDESAGVILVIMSVAAVVSLAAIVAELSALKDASNAWRVFRYGLTGLTICGSWCMVAVLFTFHYARLFYGAPKHARPLRFPDFQGQEANPNYCDFLYFSFTIAVAAQTSDVTVMSRALRKVVLAQSVLSFLFNVAIVGLSINIAAGLLGV